LAKDASKSAPVSTIDAATQAVVQQQIEAERQRLAKQASQEQQKTAAPPPPTAAPSNPTPAAEKIFKWRVEYSHGTFGTLVASQSRVSFFPESGPHTFDVPSSQVKEVKKNSGFWSGQSFHIKLANGENYNFTRIGTDNKALPSNEIVTQLQALLAAGAK
jgi:hypothetical protein